MAGSHPSFDAAAVRQSLRFAMEMGAPTDAGQRAEFHWEPVVTWPEGTRLDPEGQPLNPDVSPVITTPDPIVVPCAVEFERVAPDELPVGSYRGARAIITLLDSDYQVVREADWVALGGDRYLIAYVEPPVGMFSVTVYRLVCYAADGGES